jgi:Bacterial DNA-binding protein
MPWLVGARHDNQIRACQPHRGAEIRVSTSVILSVSSTRSWAPSTRRCAEETASNSAASVFSTRQRGAHTGRNPSTGAVVLVEQKSVPFFKPAREMHQRLNPPEA